MTSDRLTNCPNCVAPIQDVLCPYCGTVIWDAVNLSMDRPCYIRFKHEHGVTVARMFLETVSFRVDMDNMVFQNLRGDQFVLPTRPDYLLSIKGRLAHESITYTKEATP